MSYRAGHVKHNAATSEVAIRTVLPEDDFPEMAWLVSTTTRGARTVAADYVAGWADLYTPTEEGS